MWNDTPGLWLTKFIKKINKEGHKILVLGIHALHHTDATIMVASGIDIKPAS